MKCKFAQLILLSTFFVFTSSVFAQEPDFVLSKNHYFSRSNQKDGMFIIGQTQSTPKHTSENAGRYVKLNDKELVWRYEIYAPDAAGTIVYFDKLVLPKGASMYLRSLESNKISGPFFADDILTEQFATGIVAGERSVLEVHFPNGVTDNFFADISEVAYLGNNAISNAQKSLGEYGTSDACQVNVNCPEGNSWANQKRAVVKIVVKDGPNIGLCSGALVNNTAEDCKNYVLTAQHCGAGASEANFSQWGFYFNFQTPSCLTPNIGTVPTIDDQYQTGAIFRASSGNTSNINTSDFLLIELIKPIPASYNVHYAGWNKQNVGSNSGVGIHHPSGDVKKISTYTTSLGSTSWSGTPNTHWAVKWAATTNGHGVTEGGSSGSPLFDANGRIIGDLSGGGSFCSNTNGLDAYGKFAYSWSSAGSNADRQLKPWLDPNNLNPNTLNGRDACSSALPPEVDFTSDQNWITPNTLVKFVSTATNHPTNYSWSITPANGWFYSLGNASSQYVGIRFVNYGCYTISLTASNAAGSDTETKTSYICVGNTGLEDAVNSGFALYPNPVQDYLNIIAPELWKGNYSIMNVSGQILEDRAFVNSQISTQNLKPGIYYIKMYNSDGFKIIPFVKAN